MKKVLISVFAVVVILGANMALADSFPLELDRMPKELARVWKAITRLEEQIRDIQLIPGPQGEQGIQGEVGPIGPQGPVGAIRHLYDANNQDLGEVLQVEDGGTYIVTYIPSVHRTIKFKLDVNFPGIDTYNVGVVYFDGSNCTGNAFIGTPNGNLSVYGPFIDGTAYGATNTPVPPRTTQSIKVQGQGCVANGSTPSGSHYDVQEITLPFTSPIAWPVEIR